MTTDLSVLHTGSIDAYITTAYQIPILTRKRSAT